MKQMTKAQSAELFLLVAAFSQKNGIQPPEALAGVVELFSKLARAPSIMNPVGHFKPKHHPLGKPLNADDQGMGMMRIEKRADGLVYIVMGEMVANWFAMDKDGAIDFAAKLKKTAEGPADMSLMAGESPIT